MRGLVARVRSFWRGLRRPEGLDRDMDEEMRFHVQMEAERLMRERGVGRDEAYRRARVAFGSADRYKEEGRDVRGLTGVSGLSLDVKLGARMLRRYPTITLVGGLAMTIGVGLGAGYLEVLDDFLRPTLPFEEGDRIVGIQHWDVVENDPELRSMHDFVAWREDLESVRNLSAARTIDWNVGPVDGAAEPARGAEITPSAFQLVRVPALIGRTLIESDAQEGAPPVVVLGYDLWRVRFFGDPGVIGDPVRVGEATRTVVGVMPEGFGFPMSHDYWIPLQAGAVAYGPREGPPVQVFGRLAPGVSRSAAQAELAAVGARAAADLPGTHEHLRPRIVPYTRLFIDDVAPGGGREAYLGQLVFIGLLLVLSLNVATMMFARTATRENEIAMRFALGGSRRRIIAQFFVEALVLALAATTLGLALVAWGARAGARFMWEVTDGQVPFWLDGELNTTTVVYALILAVVASLVAGVMPALKATGSGLQARLRHPVGGQGAGLRFGGLWSAVVVVQVAFAVLILPPAITAVRALAEPAYVEPGFPADEYLSARIAMEMEQPPEDPAAAAAFYSEFETAYRDLEQRLLARPEVSDITFATRLPVMDHPQPWMEVEGEDGASEPAGSHWVMPTSVEPGFFDAFGARIIAGRGFVPADADADRRVVVVNEHFVQGMLQDRNPIGRRVRYSTLFGQRSATGVPRGLPDARMREPGDWYEIVGVVSGLGMDTNRDPFYPGHGPGVYHPLTPAAMGAGGSYALRTAVHVRGDAASFATPLREIAHSVSPALRLSNVLPMDGPIDSSNRGERMLSRVTSGATALIALIALIISMAGVYSVMSFTVARQTREIGVRVALGADRRRILTGVFSRAMTQIGAGLLVGYLVWIFVLLDEFGDGGAVLLLLTTCVLLLVGLVACGVPVRRALRIEPAEALREVG